MHADGRHLSVVGTVVGSYQIIRPLGEGGMGTVYLAQHTLLGRRAALKMLLPALSARPDVVNRFFNEARATTSISDPGIVQIFDFGYHVDGSAYIVMEYLEGEPLDVRLAKLGRMPVLDALRMVRQMATSLAAAHAQSIIHRDLKPENVFLVRDPEVASGERPKILDFGIAKLSDESPSKIKTHAGALMGTPAYMSPEQCRGASELDHRSDIYALGCVLFHLVAGAPPFEGEGIGDVIAAHLREPAPVLSSRAGGISPNVDTIVACCLAKRPEERFQTMLELAAAIGRALPNPSYAGSPTQMAVAAHLSMPIPVSTPTTLSAGTGQTAPPARRGRRVLALCAIVVVLGGGGAVTVSLLRGEDADSTATTAQQPIALPVVIDAATPSSQVVDAPLDAGIDAAIAPADAAIDAAVDAPAVDAVEPAHAPESGQHRTGPAKRPPRPRKPNLTKPNPEACDRRVDEDCDGIPDVR